MKKEKLDWQKSLEEWEKLNNLENKESSKSSNLEFIKHLEHASSIVKTWPKWKREILG